MSSSAALRGVPLGLMAVWLACQLVMAPAAQAEEPPQFPALLPEDSAPPARDGAGARPVPDFPVEPILPPSAPPPAGAPATSWERPAATPPAVTPPSAEGPAPRVPRPRVQRRGPEPLWKSVLVAAGGTWAVLGGVQAAAGVLTALVTAGFILVMIPAALEASPLVCVAGVCGLLPAQGLMYGVLTFAAPLLAAPVVGVLVKKLARRDVEAVPLYAAALVPGALAFIVAGAIQFVGSFGNCCMLWISLSLGMSYLQDSLGWPQQNAEYWVMRRVSPVVFFSCFSLTQLAALAAMGTGALAATGLMSLAVTWLAEPVREPRRVRPRSRSAEVPVEAPRVAAAEPLE